MEARRGEDYRYGPRPAASQERIGCLLHERESFFSATQRVKNHVWLPSDESILWASPLSSEIPYRIGLETERLTGDGEGGRGDMETERRVGVCSSIIGG